MNGGKQDERKEDKRNQENVKVGSVSE